MGKRADTRQNKCIALDKETVAFLEEYAKKIGSNVSNVLEKLAIELKKEEDKKKERKHQNQ